MTGRIPPNQSINPFREDSMTSQRVNDKNSQTIEPRSAASYPTDLHRWLGISVQEVDADLRASGDTEEAVAARMDAMVDALRSKLAPRPIEGAEPFEMLDGLQSLRFYEESVAAGVPSGNGCDVPYRMARGSDFFGQQDWKSMFLAKVSGWSMREDHITDGDVVLVDSSATPRDGDIVLAHLAGEGQLVKRLRIIDGRQIVLESANPDFAPIVVEDASALVIRGVVKGRAGKI